MRERVKDWRDWIGLQFASNTDAANTAKKQKSSSSLCRRIAAAKVGDDILHAGKGAGEEAKDAEKEDEDVLREEPHPPPVT